MSGVLLKCTRRLSFLVSPILQHLLHSKRTFHFASSLRSSPRQLDSLARVSRAARPFTLATRTSLTRTSTFQLDFAPARPHTAHC